MCAGELMDDRTPRVSDGRHAQCVSWRASLGRGTPPPVHPARAARLARALQSEFGSNRSSNAFELTTHANNPHVEADRPVQKPTRLLTAHSCRVCGVPIVARRRNGFCSDTCRLRHQRARLEALFARILPDDPGRAE